MYCHVVLAHYDLNLYDNIYTYGKADSNTKPIINAINRRSS